MSIMCAMQSCKSKPGPCGHEKLMMLAGLAAMAAAAFALLRHFA